MRLLGLLELTDQVFPVGVSVTQAQWERDSPRFYDPHAAVGLELMSALQASMPGRLFRESMTELVSTVHPGIVIAEFRLRPESGYYSRLGQPVPCPENPGGPHATGIELTLLLCRGFRSNRGMNPACIAVEFTVWGQHERAMFCRLAGDHGLAVERLLSAQELSFRTACVVDNVPDGDDVAAVAKLKRYLQAETDGESNFTLGREMIIGTPDPEAAVLTTLLPLAALYDATMGYCLVPAQRDRMFDYLALIQR